MNLGTVDLLQEMFQETSNLSNTVTFAISVLNIVFMWMLFKKAGEQGWKALIPFYSTYIAFKLFWKKEKFGWYLALTIIMIVCFVFYFFSAMWILVALEETVAYAMVIGLLVSSLVLLGVSIAILVMSIKMYVGMARSFGYEDAFAVGLVFVPTIFLGIMALGKHEYVSVNGYVPEGAAVESNFTEQPQENTVNFDEFK